MTSPFNRLNKFRGLSHENYGTYSQGKLYPNLVMEVVPGDTLHVTQSTFIRALAMIAPQLSEVDLYQYYFYVPHRILFDGWEKYITGGYDGNDTTEKPYMMSPEGGYPKGSLGDYLGLPAIKSGTGQYKHDAFPFGAYKKIFYDWFANENFYDIPDEVKLKAGLNTFSADDLDFKYKMWEKDYFTSALPSTQRGPQATLPIGTWAPTGVYPIGTLVEQPTKLDGGNNYNWNRITKESINASWFGGAPELDTQPMATLPGNTEELIKLSSMPVFNKVSNNFAEGMQNVNQFADQMSGTTISYLQAFGGNHASETGQLTWAHSVPSPESSGVDPNPAYGNRSSYIATGGNSASASIITNSPTGLMGITDLSTANAVTISAMRTAFQIQRFLEKNMRGGARLVEWTLSHFGVRIPDARLQRSELLGGGRMRMLTSVIEQTNAGADTPVGTLSGRGVISGKPFHFSKSFVEHGYVIGIMCIMPRTLYSQGLPRQFTRFTRWDEYLPVFAHLSEQEILNKEIFVSGDENVDNAAFGYNERYAELRFKPNEVHGEFKEDGSLNYWTLARQFDALPKLNKEFVTADPSNRIFAVADGADPFVGYHKFNIVAIRPLPKRGTPGLIDHD